ncbi:MAG: CehA/McbA family metallohydrolase [Bryobacterales bacterium]|nr:CehA/McbA family metallohydrolase [Bryobacterales bacterium]
MAPALDRYARIGDVKTGIEEARKAWTAAGRPGLGARDYTGSNMAERNGIVLTLILLAAVHPLSAQRVYPAAKQGGQYMHNYYISPAPSTTPWAPAWSPDGRSIAVAMHGSIWRVDPASGAATEITYGKSYHSSPAWSPDGNWLIYTADDDARSIQLEILNVATGEASALTSGEAMYLDPVFSPDGKKLAFVSTKPSGNFNLAVRAIQGGNWAGPEEALTRDNRYPRDRLYFSAWDIHTQPAWTPDGKEIVFVSNRGVPLGSGDVWRMPAEPRADWSATPVLREQTLYRTRPDVSHDGKRIVYSSTAGAADQFNNLYVTPLAGGAPYKMTFGTYDHFHPRWSPDGEAIAYIANEGGLPQLWLLETYGGKRRKVEITSRKWKRPMGRLSVRVVDDATGSLLPARIHGLASDGKFYPPFDSYSRLGNASIHTFHTKGQYTVDVPPGGMTIEAVHGFDYLPGAVSVNAEANRETAAEIRLKRIANPAASGWHSASTHVHMNYGGNLHNTPENLRFMADAEGMDAIMDLVANKDNRILDHQFFGRDTDTIHYGEEYRPPFYGHVFFLGLKEHLISPFTTGYEGTAIESLYPSNTDMFRKARAQGAINGYVHAFAGNGDPLNAQLGVGKAFPVDVALGTVDCLEWSSASKASLLVWHHALNNDFPVTPAGGEDSISNLHRTKLVGGVRTFAYTGSRFSLALWLEAVRAGRTYFSTGPLLELRVNGKLPGEKIDLESAGEVVVEGSVHSIAPLSRVVLYRNGAVYKTLGVGAFRERIRVEESAWFSLYADGGNYRLLDGEYPQAATNAVRVYVAGKPIRNAASAQYFVRWIDRLTEMAEAWPWWRTSAEKAHVMRQFGQARAVYANR